MTDIASAGWRAIGTGVRVVVHDGSLDAARAAVEDVLDAVDQALSRFRDDSELSPLNARSGEDLSVSPLLGDSIAAGLRAARITNGAVDPTVGRAMRLIGYDLDFRSLPQDGAPLEIRFEAVPGWRTVALAADRRHVRVASAVEIDMGSVGKALAADLAASRAIGATGRGGVLVSLGGDIAVAGTAPPGGWRVLVAEDSEAPADGPGEVVTIRTGAIATSSTTVRRWRRGDRDLHHLIDPRTGAPVESPWRTATVVAATCVDANTAATAAIVLGDAALDSSGRRPRRPPRPTDRRSSASAAGRAQDASRGIDAGTVALAHPWAALAAQLRGSRPAAPGSCPDPVQRRRVLGLLAVARAQSAWWPRF
jgi:thiamine biosynthesis lipoprotein